MRLDCDTVEVLLLDDLDDALDNVGRQRLDRHLADCADCRALQEKMRAAHEATAVLRRQREAATMPSHVPALVKQKLTPRQKFFGVPLWRVASTAAMVILMVAVVLVYQNVILGKRPAQTGTVSPSAAYGINKDGDTGSREIVSEGVDGSKSTAKSAQSMPIATTTAAGTRTAGADMAVSQANTPFILYNGSLEDLKQIWTIPEKSQSGATSESMLRNALSDTLSSARVLRILTNPDEPVRRVIILAGYEADPARKAFDTLQSLYRTTNPTVSVTLVDPDEQVKLTALLGQALYTQLLPSINERQLTYVLIGIGG